MAAAADNSLELRQTYTRMHGPGVALALSLALALSGCGRDGDEPPKETHEMLSFRGEDLSAAGLAEIVTRDDFAGTKVLDVKECPIGDQGLRAVAASAHAKTLTVLWADGVGATDAAARALADSPNLTLSELYLGFNDITGDGVRALASGRATAQLETLRLNFNPVGDPGARALAESQHMRSLKILFRAKTGLTDDGLRALAESPHLASLHWLEVTHNTITRDRLAALLDPARLPALTHLEVDLALVDDALKAHAATARPTLRIVGM